MNAACSVSPRRLPWAALLLLPLAGPAAADEGLAFFEQKIRPVLVAHCHECHSAESAKLKGGLRLDTKAGWERGGDSGQPALVPGQPDASLLIQAVRHTDPDFAMPPRKPRLPDAVIADLVTWVRLGAPDPRTGDAGPARRADQTWWSLQPLAATFAHDSIDGFIAARLAERNLRPGPPAEPRALIRRMSYDVTGLPPTPEEVAAFTAAFAADADAAVAALADRLLASPRYGERWGRHWLDVVRFGESNGFERNFLIDDLWPFRDWVIRSLNADKPFDRFITEHLAGDVVGRNDPDTEVGSAFLVAGPYDDVGNQDPAAKAAIRAATLDDVVSTTAGAFLGLTVGCARCHHHKFDPIPTEDYYRVRAAFEGVEHGRRVIATAEQRAAFQAATRELNAELAGLTKELDALDREIDLRAKALLAERTFPRPKMDPVRTEEPFPEVEARHLRFVIRNNTEAPGRAAPRPRGRGVTRGGGRLTEFEVWSVDGRNVALAANGGRAGGARGTVAEDFPEAYGPQLCIDGAHGEQWFIGQPAELTLTFARPERIHRVVFSNSKDGGLPEGAAQGATPCEYEILVSADGQEWRPVASSADRAPWSERVGSSACGRKSSPPRRRRASPSSNASARACRRGSTKSRNCRKSGRASSRSPPSRRASTRAATPPSPANRWRPRAWRSSRARCRGTRCRSTPPRANGASRSRAGSRPRATRSPRGCSPTACGSTTSAPASSTPRATSASSAARRRIPSCSTSSRGACCTTAGG